MRHYPVARRGTLRWQKGYQNADSFISEHIAMQTLFKLIFVLLVLSARKDEPRERALEAVRTSKRGLADARLPHNGRALAHTH